HSSFLIQIQGFNIMTDPVWARRMGFQKRLTEPGYELSELPDIDAVLISHGHYDHLDFPSIKKLRGNPDFYVPAGLKKHVSTPENRSFMYSVSYWANNLSMMIGIIVGGWFFVDYLFPLLVALFIMSFVTAWLTISLISETLKQKAVLEKGSYGLV
ncbi:MBL fold metallo-hydrolase, partial [Listeria monocytogenes]|uniref:MBL fold metallo-hydrolase n=1 Tax=Listeria monocytogenes TaxID=1639 RepID=UPI003D341561